MNRSEKTRCAAASSSPLRGNHVIQNCRRVDALQSRFRILSVFSPTSKENLQASFKLKLQDSLEMLQMRPASGKDYVDRGIQTDSSRSPSNSPVWGFSAARKACNHRVYDGSPSSPQDTSNNTPFRTSTQLDSAYIYSLPPDSDSPSPTSVESGAIPTSRRAYKNLQLSYNRPSESLNVSKKRVVSLPETVPPDSRKTILSSSTLRVSSMSERPKPSASYLDSRPSQNCFEIAASTDTSYLSADDGYSRSRARAFPSASDVPHTPSPPSSPESVMIIETDVQIPHTFLRNKPAPESHSAYSDDEGAPI